MMRSKLVALVIAGLFAAGSAVAEEKQAAAPDMPTMPGMTPAMTAMMNPMMYGNMM